jgi:SAM-dependent methyltransferase
MKTNIREERVYALGHSKEELERLSRQAQAFDPFTRHLLIQAGIKAGMLVLDVGCGSGDVAFLAADLVGPSGQVVGVDRAPAAIEWARARAQLRDIPNVEFAVGDPSIDEIVGPFDAIIGRLVLMYYPDPVDAIRGLTRYLKPGGLMIFQEFDMPSARSHPACPLYDQALGLIQRTLAATGARPQLGLELYWTFCAAGLPEPSLRFDALIGAGPGCLAYDLVAEVTQSLLPAMEKLGIARASEIDAPTLAQRLRQEAIATQAVLVAPALIGAWSRTHSPHLISHA